MRDFCCPQGERDVTQEFTGGFVTSQRVLIEGFRPGRNARLRLLGRVLKAQDRMSQNECLHFFCPRGSVSVTQAEEGLNPPSTSDFRTF
jgi:hypothetical protein